MTCQVRLLRSWLKETLFVPSSSCNGDEMAGAPRWDILVYKVTLRMEALYWGQWSRKEGDGAILTVEPPNQPWTTYLCVQFLEREVILYVTSTNAIFFFLPSLVDGRKTDLQPSLFLNVACLHKKDITCSFLFPLLSEMWKDLRIIFVWKWWTEVIHNKASIVTLPRSEKHTSRDPAQFTQMLCIGI